MIFITGDIHADARRFASEVFYEQKDMDPKEFNAIIVCGDFGLVWNFEEESDMEKWWLDWLNNKPFYTLFVDGNHENFDRLNSYPVEEWNGGKVHKIRDKVLHLMRGQIFTIEGHKFFTFGGAASHDIKDGVLDRNDYSSDKEFKNVIKEYRNDYKMFRIKNVSWWEEEMASGKDYEEAVKNLNKNDWKVDYVITHCTATSTMYLLDRFPHMYTPDDMTIFFENVRQQLDYNKWFFGHYHQDKAVNDKDICLYGQIVRLL